MITVWYPPTKAGRAIAEQLLGENYRLIEDPTCPPNHVYFDGGYEDLQEAVARIEMKRCE